MFACQQSDFLSQATRQPHPLQLKSRYYCCTAVPGASNGQINAPLLHLAAYRTALSSSPANHRAQSWRTESHDPIRRSRSLQDAPHHLRPLFFLLHASTSEPAEHITAGQSLRRFSRAESSQDSSSSSIENTCCSSIEDTGGSPERLPKLSTNATCG